MFDTVAIAPPDAILGLTDAFKADTNPDKINLGVGVYQDRSGITPILKCVKEAEQRLLRSEVTKSYLGIDGLSGYGRLSQELLFGSSHPIVKESRAATLQAPGGTGALRIAADFLHAHFPDGNVWCSNPTWANHPTIFEAANCPLKTYSYFDPKTNGLDFDAMMSDLQQAKSGDIVLLHGCCHNPCGVDPTVDQWAAIADLVSDKNLLPLVDFAYQGFGDGIEEDATGLLTLAEKVGEMLVASSYSKNFGLYRERVGTLTAVASTQNAKAAVLSQLKKTVRSNYSNPPSHGGAIVETILADAQLTAKWHEELAEMRERIQKVRNLFVARMSECAPDHDFEFIRRQRGMFSFSGLTNEQVNRLREQNSIYIVGSGRMNVAGITEDNVQRLCEAIAQVL